MVEPVPYLEAVVRVAEEYKLPRGSLQTCVAVRLDGVLGAAARHEVAFTVAAA